MPEQLNTNAPASANQTAEDFSIEKDYKERPLVSPGTYKAIVKKVSFNTERNCVEWVFQLTENGGKCVSRDENGLFVEHPDNVDGQDIYHSNWLPNAGDKDTPTPSGKSTKFQAKVNFLAEFAKTMKINMDSPAVIKESIEGLEWNGKKVSLQLDVRTYEGRHSNEVKKAFARD